MISQTEQLRAFVGTRTADPWRASDDRLLVVAGARGGTGTSTVAAGIACVAAAEGRRTLLVDADEASGTHHHRFGVTPTSGIGALRPGGSDAASAVLSLGASLDLLPGGSGTSMDGTLGMAFAPAERRSVFRRLAPLYRAYDVVIIDAGSRIDAVLAAGLNGLRKCVITSGAEPASVAAAYAMVKGIHLTWPGAPVELVLTRTTEDKARDAFGEVQGAAGRFLGRTIGFGGLIPADDTLEAAIAAGTPFPAAHEGTRAAMALDALAGRLLAELDRDARRSMAPFRPTGRPAA
ncbi:MAG: AAA family ATPase [Gemmatimonadetes bacterium]|nr:AAA family ATPase [Gemmatimonadota bacterium]